MLVHERRTPREICELLLPDVVGVAKFKGCCAKQLLGDFVPSTDMALLPGPAAKFIGQMEKRGGNWNAMFGFQNPFIPPLRTKGLAA